MFHVEKTGVAATFTSKDAAMSFARDLASLCSKEHEPVKLYHGDTLTLTLAWSWTTGIYTI